MSWILKCSVGFGLVTRSRRSRCDHMFWNLFRIKIEKILCFQRSKSNTFVGPKILCWFHFHLVSLNRWGVCVCVCVQILCRLLLARKEKAEIFRRLERFSHIVINLFVQMVRPAWQHIRIEIDINKWKMNSQYN